MNNTNRNIIIGLSAILFVFTLWRNYGVVATHGKVLQSPFGSASEKTNEQKELIEKIKNTYVNKIPTEGDMILTSFGYNVFTDGYWVKSKEIWQ
jgi:muramoyltetrapeptide carboxypeptidase LdcA involved in peptidoglycan recycling